MSTVPGSPDMVAYSARHNVCTAEESLDRKCLPVETSSERRFCRTTDQKFAQIVGNLVGLGVCLVLNLLTGLGSSRAGTVSRGCVSSRYRRILA